MMSIFIAILEINEKETIAFSTRCNYLTVIIKNKISD